jgi:hypothetical protein
MRLSLKRNAAMPPGLALLEVEESDPACPLFICGARRVEERVRRICKMKQAALEGSGLNMWSSLRTPRIDSSGGKSLILIA